MTRKCECGCGLGCKNRFFHGHNRKGQKRSAEAIEKMRAKLLEPEFNIKWRVALKNGWTDETKEVLRKANIGKVLSSEHKEKIGNGNKGKVRTEEMKKVYSERNIGKRTGDENPMRNPEIANLFRGKNNHNWKGGISRIYKNGYYSTEYLQWRKSVFERDNYTCQNCGLCEGKYMTAHHIKSFAYYAELRFDIDNGITLCEQCHSKTDNYKGRNKKKILFNN